MGSNEEKLLSIRNHLKSYPDFPKTGIQFWDIFSVLQDPQQFHLLHDVILSSVRAMQPPVDAVAALDARGFLFGPIIALDLNIPFIPIRKKGKLPGDVHQVTFSLEYGQDTLEIQKESVKNRRNILIVDDVLATGGTLKAACDLINCCGSNVASCLVILELSALEGRKKIKAPIETLIKL